MSEKEEATISWIKSLFFKAGNHFAVKLITKFLLRFGLNLWGPFGWVASFFIAKVLKKVWAFGIRLYFHWSEDRETKKEVKEYSDKINKPNATVEEVGDAGKNFLES